MSIDGSFSKKRILPVAILITGLLAVPVCLFLILVFIGERTFLGILVPYATLAEPTH